MSAFLSPSDLDLLGVDAVVVGSGPNGLAAAITLAQAGWNVRVLERADTPGGGLRSASLTLPCFLHDVCAATHPLAIASPFLKSLPLEVADIPWLHSPNALAHPFDDAPAAVIGPSVGATADRLGVDGAAYQRLLDPLVRDASPLIRDLLGPLRVPARPAAYARFGAVGLLPATTLARQSFTTDQARALLLGCAAHSVLPLSKLGTSAVGLILMLLGHSTGWPVVEGGSQVIAERLVRHLRSLGGDVITGVNVTSMAGLESVRAVLFDTTPRALSRIAGSELPVRDHVRFAKFRYGPGAFKVDWALEGPIPWSDPACATAATVHVGGDASSIARSEAEAAAGIHPTRPFVLLGQQSIVDPNRAPAGQQVAWGYCHVPAGSILDMTSRIEAQIERFAPGFRDRILAHHTTNPVEWEAYNPNYIGGDIGAGSQDIRQVFTRPTPSFTPYATGNPRIFLCSASTPPGGGVHFMAGVHAARAVLRRYR